MLIWLISLIFSVLDWIIIIDCFLSWIPNINQNKFTVVINSISDIILTPIRNILSRFNYRLPIDISPIIAFVLLNVIESLLKNTIYIIVGGRWII